MLTGNLTARVEVPHERGNFFEFRLLGWVALEEARSVRSTKALRAISGVTDVINELRQARQDNDVQTAAVDPLNDYDRMTLLCKGLVAWYGPYYDDQQLSPDAIAGLDETTAKWAAEQILQMHVQTQDEREAGLFRVGSGT